MSLMIRLSKIGRKGESRYRICVLEKRERRDGKPIETIGWFEKTQKGNKKEIDKKRYDYWLSQGARPSQTVTKLI